MTAISPATDHTIAQRYTEKSLEKKGKNKTAFQEEIGWAPEERRPIICLPAGLTQELGGALFSEVLPGILTEQVEILILGKGSEMYGKLATDLAKTHRHCIHIVKNEEDSVRKMYAASDIMLCLNDPKNLRELSIALQYGVIPIAPKGALNLENYNVVQETGNAFLYEEKNPWAIFAAVIRAVETYKLPFDWRTIQRHCMETVI